jgi:AraC family transcriptional regulator
MRPTTVTSYGERIARVATHIGANLDARLSLDDLADVAALSPFHFHRVYRAIQGETTSDTVRRLRLHRAAVDLIEDARDLARIAARAGYGSQAAFTRAFAEHYGTPPAAYRARHAPEHPPSPTHVEANMTYTTEIKTFPGATLATLPHRGSYHAIGPTFEKLSALAGGQGLFGPATRMIGIYLDDPASMAEAELRSIAGLTIDAGAAVKAPIERYVLAPTTYAGIVHKGPYAELPNAYAFLYRAWLPASGREPADRPCFEMYLNDPRGLPPTEWLTEVCLPLA